MTNAPPINIAEVLHKVLHAEQMLDQTDAAAAARVRAVVDAGKALSDVKASMPHGLWEPWMKENLEKVSPRTARNWMKMHEFHEANGDSIFDDVKSLRQAYKLAGIIPEVSSAGTNRNRETVDYVLHLGRLELSLRKMDFVNMAADEKAVVRSRLEGVVRVYNAL